MRALLQYLFGCWHSRTTWPQTRRTSEGASTWVTCLACGRELPYNLETMTRGK